MNFVNGFTDFMGHCSAMLTFLSCVCVYIHWPLFPLLVSKLCVRNYCLLLLFLKNNTLLFLLKYHSIGYETIELERSFKKRYEKK
jgi:hypothetical protein